MRGIAVSAGLATLLATAIVIADLLLRYPYAFRLCYYAYWHLLWGAARLELLF